MYSVDVTFTGADALIQDAAKRTGCLGVRIVPLDMADATATAAAYENLSIRGAFQSQFGVATGGDSGSVRDIAVDGPHWVNLENINQVRIHDGQEGITYRCWVAECKEDFENPVESFYTGLVPPVTVIDPAEGATGAAVPADAMQIGGPDAGGLLRAPVVRPTNPANTDNGIVARTIEQNATGFKQAAIQVDTTATPLSGSLSATRTTLAIQNLGPNDIFIGDATVTDATGFAVAAGTETTIENLIPGVIVYAICSALQVSPADTRILELV